MTTAFRASLLAAVLAPAALAQITLPATIDDASFGPLRAGMTYVANQDITVTANATQTIEPGAILKFAAAGAEFRIRNGAMVQAVGTRSAPIVFTSIHDDSVGVPLGTRMPQAGDWDDVDVRLNGGGRIEFAEIRYAGQGDDPSLVLRETAIAIRDVLVRDGLGDGIEAQGTPTIERCAVRRCQGYAIDGVAFTNLPNLRDNVATGNTQNSLRVGSGTCTVSTSVGPENGLNDEIYLPGSLQFNGAGVVGTFRPGLIVKIANRIETVLGASLLAMGQPNRRITITSVDDDTVGNDTRGDGPTVGSPGDWTDIRAAAPGSALEYVDLRFAGRSTASDAGAVRASSGSFRMAGCVVERSGANGLSLAGSDPTIQACTIRDCNGRAILGARLAALPRFSGNTATGCVGGNSLDTRAAGSTAAVDQPVTIRPENLLEGQLLAQSLDVRGPNAVLTLEAGVVVKLAAGSTTSQGGRILARGSATSPVVFTSLPDDSVGNDALGDGPTNGQPGDWSFVNLFSTGSEFDFSTFRFGGRGFSNGAVIVLQRAVGASFRDCVIDRSSQSGINLLDPQPRTPPATVERCDFRDNAERPLINVDWREVPFLCDNTANGNGNGDHLVIASQREYDRVAIYKHNTLNGSGVIQCVGASFFPGQEFFAGPGLIFKLSAGSFLCDIARLVMDGRGDAPIVITSIRDDSIGGDTNLDGNATAPSPGDWGLIRYSNDPRCSGYLAHVHARYGGGGFSTNCTLSCSNPNVRITSMRVDFSQRLGFNVSDVMSPAANWIAYGCQSAGIKLVRGNFTVQHATATENAGVGIFGESGYSGTVYSSISWNNGRRIVQDNFVTVRHTKCNGSTLSGNINADPMFADVQNGDLHISPFSLCVGRGDLPQATLWGVDFDGNSRILDHALNGLALPDIGAYEVFQYRMGVTGEMRLGRRVDFTVDGPGPRTGFQAVLAGPALGGTFVPPFGVLIAGDLQLVLTLMSQPTGSSFAIDVPDDPLLVGARLGIQTLVVTDTATPAGNLTNALLATITR